MKTILRFCVLSFGLLFSIATIAQESTISGKVTSAEDGSSLPGVNVVVKGTTTGTVTDFDGNYKLSIADGNAQLVFSFIGMVTQEITVGSQTTINVSLVSDATQLSEVVVVGYGTQTKEQLTGSVAIVDPATLEMMPTASFQSALQGSSTGLQVVTNDGAPGAAISVRVRGIGS
ncbi:MAG: carboxypeptidase-like regulatory domain-containing protein, partial [Cyclobacteriaceae bacterium]|nr:carboxypeptidase-like regulatory domain-containing protein [Cyclobacteriaceae bacterium]